MMHTTIKDCGCRPHLIALAIVARDAVSKEADGAVADDGAQSNAQHETRD